MGRLMAIEPGSGIGPIRTKLRRLINGRGKKGVLPSGYEQEGGFLLLAAKRWTLLSDLHKIDFNYSPILLDRNNCLHFYK